MRTFWEWVGVILGMAAVFSLAVVSVVITIAMFLFWPAMAIIVVFIAGKAVGVW